MMTLSEWIDRMHELLDDFEIENRWHSAPREDITWEGMFFSFMENARAEDDPSE